jgi:pimeloyl-ACP methyl ester carboxylesterase
MPAMRRVLLIVTLLLAGACRQQGQAALDRLHPCRIDEGPPDAYCGTHRVFEDRTARTGRVIDLKIVVAPALRRDPRPDPLFVFEGGPGGGAATLASTRIPMFRRFQTNRDIVLIDQRGTGASNPLDCAPDDPDEDGLGSIDAYPVERFRSCLERLDADPSLYTTAIAMDDIDEVRRALGYGRINLWGGSYGTRAALVYLKQHEPSVRSVVLDGVAPPDMRLPLFMARDGQRALDGLLDACERDAGCAGAYPGLPQTVEGLWRTLADRPTVAFTHPRTGKPMQVAVSQRLVATIVFQSLYTPEVTALLPQLLVDASKGQFQGLFALAFSADLPKGAMSEGMFLSVVCAEDMPRITREEIAREAASGFIGSAMFDTRMKPCEFWPKGVVSDEYYAPITSAKPVLLFSGENDPVTPPSWAERAAATLPTSRHLVVPGAGHITLMRGCVPQLVARFLDNPDPSAVDPACLQSLTRPPFFTTYTGPETPR